MVSVGVSTARWLYCSCSWWVLLCCFEFCVGVDMVFAVIVCLCFSFWGFGGLVVRGLCYDAVCVIWLLFVWCGCFVACDVCCFELVCWLTLLCSLRCWVFGCWPGW